MYNSADVTWTLVAAFLVFFMQAGFALCEAGLTRAKNTGNILMKNMMDFCIGTPCYWLVGFGVMFAGSGALIGGFDPFIRGSYDYGAGDWAHRYIVTDFTETSMVWTAKDDRSDVQVFVRCDGIPDEVTGGKTEE